MQDLLLSFHLKSFHTTPCLAHQKRDSVLGHEYSSNITAKQKDIFFLLFNPFLPKLKILT